MSALRRLQEKVMQREKIYIFPNQFGFMYLGVIVIMILVGATYNNNLIYLLGFFLFSVFVSSMVQTHNNIKDIQVEVTDIEDCFEGERPRVRLVLRNRSGRVKQSLRVVSRDKELRSDVPGKVDIIEKRSLARSYLYLKEASRGLHELKDLTLYTVYPMGLFYSWKYVRADVSHFVYPKPVDAKLLPRQKSFEELLKTSKTHKQMELQDDFKEHKLYVSGESEHHIDWKVYARTREKLVKTFESPAGVVMSFDLSATRRILPLEEALSQISFWIRKAIQKNEVFELILDEEGVSASQGVGHAKICFRRLAEYGSGPG